MAVDHEARVGSDGLAYRRDACQTGLHRAYTVTRRADPPVHFVKRCELEGHVAGRDGCAGAGRETFGTALLCAG